MTSRIRICGRDELSSGTARRFEIEDRQVAVIRIDDDFYALGDTCSHEDYSLSEGEVFTEEREIECAKHGSTFDLTTGKPCSLPATTAVPVYRVVVDGDDVVVEVP
jgi:3-phenylpropionate/trans-cinnamate dioxygenase ferredoxin subunit